jgi:CheY-like chemotaxis protein
MAFADLIRVTAEEGSDIRQYAENILASSRRSADLTGQLLAFARKGNLLKMPVDMHRLIADLVSLLAHTFDKRISIIQALSASEATILGDPSQLHGAILNISINARDAMPGGGELSFTTNNLSLDPAYCATIPQSNLIPGKYLCISIADTGCGMDKETQQRIFEPFFTTKEPGRGTGMGLPAVYGIITSHNGAITVYSEKGKGTTVHLYFPLLIAQQSGIQTARDAGPRQKCEGNVLLVDDEQLVAEGSRKMLEALGYTATVFYTGTEALGYYADHWKDVDIVILDMIMPAMGGKETFVAMKQINPGIVALLASGYSINGEAQSILDTGVRGFIQKPFTLDELRDKLVSVLPVNRPPQSVT